MTPRLRLGDLGITRPRTCVACYEWPARHDDVVCERCLADIEKFFEPVERRREGTEDYEEHLRRGRAA